MNRGNSGRREAGNAVPATIHLPPCLRVYPPGSHINGRANCSGAQLTSADQSGNALVAERMKVAGSVFLEKGFTAAGAVRLPGADINGQVIGGHGCGVPH